MAVIQTAQNFELCKPKLDKYEIVAYIQILQCYKCVSCKVLELFSSASSVETNLNCW